MSNKEERLCLENGGSHTLSVGHGNFILKHRIVAILESNSLPVKRLRQRASQENLLIDATAGRKTRSVVITDSEHVILSALAPQTLEERIIGLGTAIPRSRLEWEEGELVS